MNKTQLIREAKQSAKFRGHNLTQFQHIGHVATAQCRKCGAYVIVNSNPLPNEISIGGNGVAINCK